MRVSNAGYKICIDPFIDNAVVAKPGTWNSFVCRMRTATIKRLLKMTIDIVVHIRAHAGRRRITGIDFDPQRDPGAP